MNLYLSDAGGAGLLFYSFGLGVLVFVLIVLIEAAVMKLMKYHTLFKKAFLDSLIVNILSLAVGFGLLLSYEDLFNNFTLSSLAILYAVTVAVEFGMLYLLNRKEPVGKTFGVCLTMNLVTYILLFIITRL